MTYDDWKTTDPRDREPEEREEEPEEPEQETIITQVGDGALFQDRGTGTNSCRAGGWDAGTDQFGPDDGTWSPVEGFLQAYRTAQFSIRSKP